MKKVLIAISFIGLVLTILPPILVFNGVLEMKTHFTLMIIGMVCWFTTAPFWMKNKSLNEDEKHVE